MANFSNHKKGIIVSETDLEILNSLYKTDFLCDYHAAIIIGESRGYVAKRLRDLTKAGLVGRKVLKANCPAANWITKKGIQKAGLTPRNVRPPTLGRYEHSLGVADVYVYFCLFRKLKDGRLSRFVHFGDIITERDFNSVRELKEVGRNKNGQPILKSMDFDIHHPDGYFCRNGKYCALEFERTAKSTFELVRDNARDNAKRFTKQFWVYNKKSVFNYLLKVQHEIGADKIQIIDYCKVREQLQKAVTNLPAVISKKSGKPRRSAFGNMAVPIPLNRIPLLPSAVKKPVLESRTKATVTPTIKTTTTKRTKKPIISSKPKLKLEKRGRK